MFRVVLTDKKTNSSKSCSVIDECLIDKLQFRNEKLCDVLEEGKDKEELKIAVKENLPKRFYLSFIAR